MSTGAVCLNELHDAGVLINTGVWNVLCPTHWGVRNVHCVEDLIPEGIIGEQARHGAQEFTGHSTLDHAVIVGGGDGDKFANAELCKAVF